MFFTLILPVLFIGQCSGGSCPSPSYNPVMISPVAPMIAPAPLLIAQAPLPDVAHWEIITRSDGSRGWTWGYNFGGRFRYISRGMHMVDAQPPGVKPDAVVKKDPTPNYGIDVAGLKRSAPGHIETSDPTFGAKFIEAQEERRKVLESLPVVPVVPKVPPVVPPSRSVPLPTKASATKSNEDIEKFAIPGVLCAVAAFVLFGEKRPSHAIQ